MKRILSLRLSTALLIFALAVTPALAQSGVSNFTNIKSSGYTVAGQLFGKHDLHQGWHVFAHGARVDRDGDNRWHNHADRQLPAAQ